MSYAVLRKSNKVMIRGSSVCCCHCCCIKACCTECNCALLCRFLLIHSYIIHEVLIKSTQGPKFRFVPDSNPNRFISSTRLQFKHFLNNLEPIYYFLLVYDRQIVWN